MQKTPSSEHSTPSVSPKPSRASIWAVIPASGIGSRMQSDIPKQYLTLNGLTVMEQTLNKIDAVDEVVGIILVVNKEDKHYQTLDLSKYKHIHIVEGGATRADSVLQGLLFVKRYLTQQADVDTSQINIENTWALVHDCARPCVEVAFMHTLINTCLAENTGGILAEKVADTVKESTTESTRFPHVISTKDRSALWLAQTPQFFKLTLLINAITQSVKQGLILTDEASAIEQQGGDVLLISSPKSNIKITQPSDLTLAQAILATQ